MVVAAAGWAGTILGSVSGLSWADDFDPGSGEATAGIGRLAWWVGVAAFVAAGGQLVVIAGLLDSLHAMPVGAVLRGEGFFDTLLPRGLTAARRGGNRTLRLIRHVRQAGGCWS